MIELIDEKIKHVWGLCLTIVVTTTSTVKTCVGPLFNNCSDHNLYCQNLICILIVITLCHKFMEAKVIAQKPIII